MSWIKFIDKARTELQVTSDSKVADAIGITRSALSQAKRGDSTLSQDTLAKLARAAKVKPETVIAAYELQRPHIPAVKEMWKRIAGKTLAAGYVLGTSLLSSFGLWADRTVYILC